MSPEPHNFHEDTDLFREALSFTQSETGFSARLVEKDYYCSLLLQDLLTTTSPQWVFKGVENPTDEELRRFDKQRKDKRVSNEEWVSETDPDSRIAKMKDGPTHLAYKAEHVVDLKTELVLAASIRHADEGDADTMVNSVVEAR